MALAAKSGPTQRGRFTVALSGGSTPRRLYELLATPAYAEKTSWERWHVFWGDERCVPPDHPDSNYRMAREALLDRVPIPPSQIHRIKGEAVPYDAAEAYEHELCQSFGEPTPAFDLVLLGLGEDGHTASLFPGTNGLEEERRLVMANWVPHLQAYRITFTLPLINAARNVAFLVTDGSKAEVLRKVLAPTPGDPLLTAARVQPRAGTLHWFLSKAAVLQS